MFLRHDNGGLYISELGDASDALDATFQLLPGLSASKDKCACMHWSDMPFVLPYAFGRMCCLCVVCDVSTQPSFTILGAARTVLLRF